MTKYTITKEQAEELEKLPYLKQYVNEYIENDGVSKEPGYLTSLAYFFKRKCIDNNLDEEATFDWDEETAEDFYTWGTNSRWGNTFESCLATNFNSYIDIAIELAKEYGDSDIYNEGE